MMIKVEAYVREDKFEDVKAALNAIGVNGLTVSQVMGCGIQRGYKEIVRGMQVDMQMQKNGKQKQLKRLKKLPIQENLAMARYLLMRFVMLKRFVRKKLDMMRFRQQNNKNNNKGLSENR